MIGVFEWEEFTNADRMMAPLFVVIFMILFTYVFTNIFIALLEESYSAFRNDRGSNTEIYNPFSSMLIFLVAK
jgi:hypothetical protein